MVVDVDEESAVLDEIRDGSEAFEGGAVEGDDEVEDGAQSLFGTPHFVRVVGVDEQIDPGRLGR